MNKHLKIGLTLLFLLAAGLIATQALDEQGQHYTNEALKRSLVTFGVARGLNGVISVAQGTEVALQPAGIGLTFTPGQILDPLNENERAQSATCLPRSDRHQPDELPYCHPNESSSRRS